MDAENCVEDLWFQSIIQDWIWAQISVTEAYGLMAVLFFALHLMFIYLFSNFYAWSTVSSMRRGQLILGPIPAFQELNVLLPADRTSYKILRMFNHHFADIYWMSFGHQALCREVEILDR